MRYIVLTSDHMPPLFLRCDGWSAESPDVVESDEVLAAVLAGTPPPPMWKPCDVWLMDAVPGEDIPGTLIAGVEDDT